MTGAKQYEPALGDVVAFTLDGAQQSGDVVELLQPCTVGVRVTELGSARYGQVVYFNAGFLTPVTFGR